MAKAEIQVYVSFFIKGLYLHLGLWLLTKKRRVKDEKTK